MHQSVRRSFFVSLALLLTGSWVPLGAATYEIDPVHTTVHFRVKHLSTSLFLGRFNDVSGTLTFDEDNPGASSIEIEVKADSVDSGDDELNEHVMGPDFLSAREFPTISFRSSGFKELGGNKYEVTGKFVLRSISKDLTAEVEHVGSSDFGRFGPRVGFSTTFTINRRDFHVNYGKDEIVGDEVTLIVNVEAKRPAKTE